MYSFLFSCLDEACLCRPVMSIVVTLWLEYRSIPSALQWLDRCWWIPRLSRRCHTTLKAGCSFLLDGSPGYLGVNTYVPGYSTLEVEVPSNSGSADRVMGTPEGRTIELRMRYCGNVVFEHRLSWGVLILHEMDAKCGVVLVNFVSVSNNVISTRTFLLEETVKVSFFKRILSKAVQFSDNSDWSA